MKILLDQMETVKVKKELAVPEPKFHCASCERCSSDSRCGFFQRQVEPNHNRCFNHSMYTSPTIQAVFKPIPKVEMDKIVAESEQVA